MSAISLTSDFAALAMTADGSGNASAEFVLGDYHGFSITWALSGGASPSIVIKGTNKPGGVVADAHDITTGVTVTTPYGLDPKNKFSSYFISVSGATPAAVITAYVRRWR